MSPATDQKVLNRNHIAIINQGVDYIVDHLFEKLTVEMIADHCCFSRHYYNRLFKSVTRESVYSFIKRVRIETAACKLIKFSNLSITSIAAELGYSSSNFSVMFKKHYNLSPSQFRLNPELPLKSSSHSVLQRIQELQENKPVTLLQQMDKSIRFKELPDIKLVYKRFKGNYQNLAPVWQAFCTKMEHSFPDFPIEFYGISYDDPLIAQENKCLYDLCARVTDSVKVKGENFRKIPGGLYLCCRFGDHVRKINQLYNDLFAVWMPHRGYTMGHGLCFERYFKESVPGGNVVMDLCIPVLSNNRAQIQK